MPTLKDVAREAGLTVGTVSRVLNNRGYISEDTRKKVYRVMEELNYQPNEVARSLSKKTSNTIGVIVPHIDHPYFSKLIGNLESAAQKASYKILLCNSHADTEREWEYIEMCRSNKVAGIVLCSASVNLSKLKTLDIPVITIEREEDASIAGITCDNYLGGKLAAEHLIERGCKNILHLSGIAEVPMPADQRAVGFAQACEARGIPFSIIESDAQEYYNIEYADYVLETLKNNPKIDGIFASSDVIAAQVIQCCSTLNISIPEQMKIVGFDDVSIARFCTPPLTTIRQPILEMSEAAIRLIQDIRDEKMVPKHTILPVCLIKRSTT